MQEADVKRYGNFGNKRKPMPEFYNQNLILETDFNGVVLAKGKWIAREFVIFKDSRVMQEYLGQNNNNVVSIINKLLEDDVVSQEYPYFVLRKDILVDTSSTAASLVHGNNRTGFRDWKHEGLTLEEILLKIEQS